MWSITPRLVRLLPNLNGLIGISDITITKIKINSNIENKPKSKIVNI